MNAAKTSGVTGWTVASPHATQAPPANVPTNARRPLLSIS
jgi:hypothetical protein